MIEYEKFHLDAENRKSGKYLEILHPDYEEHGQSGKKWKKEDYINIKLDASVYEIEQNECILLSDEARLSKYVLFNKSTQVRTNKSSIWVLYNGDWKMIFHQGTRTE